MKILIVGGSKSGKSMAAQRIARMLAARGSCPAYYWATMEPSDSEDEKRIARHLEARAGWGFETIECGRNTSAFSASVRGGCVLFDSVTALLANEMFPPPAQNADFSVDFAAGERVAAELSEIANAAMHFICVCDDIFRDGMQYDAVTESYLRCQILKALLLYRAGAAAVPSAPSAACAPYQGHRRSQISCCTKKLLL